MAASARLRLCWRTTATERLCTQSCARTLGRASRTRGHGCPLLLPLRKGTLPPNKCGPPHWQAQSRPRHLQDRPPLLPCPLLAVPHPPREQELLLSYQPSLEVCGCLCVGRVCHVASVNAAGVTLDKATPHSQAPEPPAHTALLVPTLLLRWPPAPFSLDATSSLLPSVSHCFFLSLPPNPSKQRSLTRQRSSDDLCMCLCTGEMGNISPLLYSTT